MRQLCIVISIGIATLGTATASDAQHRVGGIAQAAALQADSPAFASAAPLASSMAVSGPKIPGAIAIAADSTVVSWPWGWMARGIFGGIVAGPIGAGIAYSLAGSSRVELPAGSESAYSAELEERVRTRRKEAAFVGGMLGTGVFAYVILRAIQLQGSSGGDPGNRQPEPV